MLPWIQHNIYAIMYRVTKLGFNGDLAKAQYEK